jgi:7,8-dihydropterin-6-yl-methyl-4-(beta-D-ribofuranosyl)aminobenzene 5'-phosphate synthase
MRISVLTENHAGSSTMAEHGLSYMIEHDGKRILFDTGQSDLFVKNAKIMNVSIEEIDNIVLSHGHFDHGNGLSYISGLQLICHPGCFIKRYSRKDKRYIGLKNNQDELQDMYNLTLSAKPYNISEKIIFLGEIPRVTDFESKNTTFIFEDGTPDFVMDDSAIALILDEGLFLVTGCGHAGIVNTLEHARKVSGISRIYGIMGGFHLKEIDRQTIETIKYLKESQVKHVLPSHCTELPALSAFYESFRIKQLKTGDIINF